MNMLPMGAVADARAEVGMPKHLAAPDDQSSAGTGVQIGVPILIILILFYMVTHKGHKVSGIVLAFVAGAMLAGTQLATSLADLVDQVVGVGATALTDLFS
jgi:hypothetical protein